MDLDFAIMCPLVRIFVARFFQIPPRDDAPALRHDFTAIRLSKGTFPFMLSNMLGKKTAGPITEADRSPS